MTSRLANVCRRQCQLKFATFASLSTGSNQRRGSLAPPQTHSEAGPLAESLERPNGCLIQRDSLIVPFLLRGIVSMRSGSEAFSQSNPYCSLKRSPVLRARSNSGIRSGHFPPIALRSAVSSLADGQKPNASIVLKPMLYDSGRILFHLAISNRKPVRKRKQRAVAVSRGRSPFLLLELALNILSRDGFGGILAEPSAYDFHTAGVAAKARACLVDLRVGQCIFGNRSKCHGGTAEPLRKLLSFQSLYLPLPVEIVFKPDARRAWRRRLWVACFAEPDTLMTVIYFRRSCRHRQQAT
jgi:hypothetical protein